jgi:flagellar basal-body rod protein FlgC
MIQHVFNQSLLSRALYAATSGMNAQNQRVLVISQNLANSNTRPTFPGEMPYRRRVISLKSAYDANIGAELVKVKSIRPDLSPFSKIYAPEDPAADSQGFVLEANVKPMVEMVDLREASHQHEANVRAFEKILGMLTNVISLLKLNS